MQINKLTLKNYKQYCDAEINFPEGLTGFIGSNGSGKSTILEAVAYALYGKCSNAKEDIRNDNASPKEPVLVEVTFNDKGKDYRVNRLLKGKALTASAELYCDDMLIASQSTEVNKQIIKLLKIDYKNFKRSYFSEQKDVTALLSMKTGERQVEIRKMLGLEKLDKLEERIKEHTKELKSRISVKKEQLLSEDKIITLEQEKAEHIQRKETTGVIRNKTNDELLSAKKEYQDAKGKVSEYEILRDKHMGLEKELSITRTRISGIEKQINSACEELILMNKNKERSAELKPFKEKYDILNEELQRMISAEAVFTKVRSLLSSIDEKKKFITEKIDQIKVKEQETAGLVLLEIELKEKSVLLKSKEELITAKNGIRDSIKEIKSSAETQLKQKQKRLNEIKSLGKDSQCPECERPLKEHYDKLVAEYENQINEFSEQIKLKAAGLTKVDQELASVNSEKETLAGCIKEIEFRIHKIGILKKDIVLIQNEINEAENKVKGIEAELEKIGEVSFDPEKLKILRVEERELKPYSIEFTELTIEIKGIPVLEKKLESLKTDKNRFVNCETELNEKIVSLNYEDEEYNTLKQNCILKEQLKENIQIQLFSIESELTEILNKLKNLIQTLDQDQQTRELIKTEEDEIGLYDRLAGFVNTFKQRIASQEMPAISLEASRLFSNITRGRYTDLIIDNDYELYVNRDANKVLLNTLSGGEKDLAGLCLRIAISKRIAALAGRENMGFLALDEVFGSQDESRREELMNALFQISHDFRQIFVISHNEDVKEAFPNRIHIRKDGKYSVVEVGNV